MQNDQEKVIEEIRKIIGQKEKITGLMYLTKQIVAAQLLNQLKSNQ